VNADTIAVLLILMMAPAWTLLPILIGFTTPWRDTLLGHALMIATTGLALLIDISLMYQWLGDDYFLRDVVRLSVYALILLGGWLMLLAFVRARFLRRTRRQPESLA
jgi:hypothetical protein